MTATGDSDEDPFADLRDDAHDEAAGLGDAPAISAGDETFAPVEAEHSPGDDDPEHVDEGEIDAENVDADDADADPFGDSGDPDHDDLLTRWTDEAHHESDAPGWNWVPWVAAVSVLVFGTLAVLGARALIDRSGDDDPVAGARGEDAIVGSVLQEDPPSLEELISDVTLPPGPESDLELVERGVTVVQDRFDETRREGTFALIVENPHDDWLAQGVQVDVAFLGADGQQLGTDSGFIEIVLPSQRVAVAGLFFDAPEEPIVDLAVAIDVARWRETEPIGELFTITDVVTQEAEFSGVETTFVLAVDFDRRLTDVGVTAVYRDETGRIIGGYDTFLELVEPDAPVEGVISMLANVDPESIAATELYPTAAFGFIPDD